MQMAAPMSWMVAMVESANEVKASPRDSGIPRVFGNSHEGRTKCSRAFENFALGNFGEDFCLLVEYAADSESMLTETDIEEVFGNKADGIDQIDEEFTTRMHCAESGYWKLLV